MGSFLVDWYTDVYLTVYGIDTTYTDIVLKFNGYLKQILKNESFARLCAMVWIIGFSLMLIYFVSDMSEKAAAKQLTFQQGGKAFCLLLVGTYLTFHTKELFILFLNISETLNRLLSQSWKTGSQSITSFLKDDAIQTLLKRSINDYFTIWSAVGYTFQALILYLVSLATKAIVIYMSAMRVIELFAYAVYAPIGISDIFEHGPGGIINMGSSGIKYLKRMLSISLQIVVITVVCQCFSVVTTAVNSEYWKLPVVDIPIIGDGMDLIANALSYGTAVYPLARLEYTDEKGIQVPIYWEWKRLTTDSDEPLDEPGEVHPATDVVDMNGEIVDEDEYNKIMKNDGFMKNYHMTVKSTERFFDWCVGSIGSKMILMCILMLTKIIMILTSARLCDSIVGVR